MTKKLDLLLVNPGTNKEVYGKLSRNYAAKEPPFMAGAVAGFVRSHGKSVEILDANATDLTYSQTADVVKEIDPALVATIVHGHQPSASSQLMGAVGEMCKEIKGVTNAPILLSGLHPSALPERTLREEECDFVVEGEEHETIFNLLGSLKSKEYSGIPGLCYLDEGNFVRNKTSPLADLNEDFPDIAWDLIPELKTYRAHNWHAGLGESEERSPYGSLYTSLGCPFKCSFCNINVAFKANIIDNTEGQTEGKSRLENIANTNPTIRYWNKENILKSLDYFAEQDVKHVKFIDEMFVLNKKHVTDIADAIIERGYNFNIWAYARVDTVKDEKLLEKIKGAGINWLVLGIEAANSTVRQGAEKNFKDDAVYENVKRVENAGINVMGNYMVGLRGETMESMRETLSMAKALNTPWFNIYGTMAYPGTADYQSARERGILLPGDEGVSGGWTAYSHHSWHTLPQSTEDLTAAEILKFRDDAFHDYFSNPSYLALIERTIGEKGVNAVKKMTEYRISRRILGDAESE